MEILLVGLITTIINILISNSYHKKNEKRRLKINLLNNLLGNRYDVMGEEFTKHLNSIFIVFHDSNDVKEKLKSFYENTLSTDRSLANQKLLELFKVMCQNVKIDTKPLNDDFFLKPFNLK